MCGCGQPASLASTTRSWLGHIKGEPMRYINGHNGRRGNILAGDEPPYDVRDCGYKTPCWYWLRHATTGGYGRVTVDGVRLAAHVIYYEQAKGRVPEGLELDHLCRVRRCVNPDHLEAVTHAENVRRGAMGKVSTATLIEIRNAPGKDAEVAARYGLSQAYVNRIRRGLIAGAP
jgi:hypothetical protein